MIKLSYPVFNLVALSIVIFLGVDIFYCFARSWLSQNSTNKVVMQESLDLRPYIKPPLDAFKEITDRNIFGSIEQETNELPTEDIESLEPTSLMVSLLGTVIGNERDTYAIIEETAKRKQDLYRRGDSIQDATIKKILRGKVILRVGDKDEILTMEEVNLSPNSGHSPSSITHNTGPTITIDRQDLQASLKDIGKLMTQVRVRPYFKDGKAEGLFISRIRAGSVFTKLGLQNGDIVQGINGSPIRSPDDVFSLYENLKSGSRVSLQFTRKGESKTINYSFQ